MDKQIRADIGGNEMKLPEWANWLARDEDGSLFVSKGKPYKVDNHWEVSNPLYDGIYETETDDRYKNIKWTDEQPTSVKSLIKDFSDKAESLRELGEALTRNWEAEHGKPSVAEYNQWQITQAKAHGYDEVPELTDKTERVHVDEDGVEITVGETTSISFEEAMALVENKMVYEPDTTHTNTDKDMVNQPNHYIGEYGLEVEDVLRNFIPRYTDPYVGHRIASAIEYLLRSPLKNGQQDIEKARKNLDQALVYMEAIE